MHDLALADAARPTPAVILKLPMLPYSIGHELLLQQSRNPIIGERDFFDGLPLEQQFYAVMKSALICSQDWQQNNKVGFFTVFNRHGRRKIRNENYSLAIANFRNYRESGSTFPTLLTPKKDEDTTHSWRAVSCSAIDDRARNLESSI